MNTRSLKDYRKHWHRVLDGKSGTGMLRQNVEYWSQRLPYVDTNSCIGVLDYAKIRTDGKLTMRGWLFCLAGSIESLEFLIGERWHPVLCYGLSRNDVGAILGFIPQTRQSGFVFECDRGLIAADAPRLSITFRALSSNGEVIVSKLEPTIIALEPAITGCAG